MEQGTVLVEHGTLFGELPAGGFDRIAERDGDEGDPSASLDDVALEAGTD
jgi:argininosuccinate synthase